MGKASVGAPLPAAAGNQGRTNHVPVGEDLPAQSIRTMPDRKILQMDGTHVTVSGTIREDR